MLARRGKTVVGEHELAVIDGIVEGVPVSEDVAGAARERLTAGQHAADAVARFGGSWRFIGVFGGVIAAWMAINVAVLARAFDPYPFILLNLALSCLAAIQAPIIMMSQRRRDERDRLMAENDYRVNLKAELEVRELREAVECLREEHGALLRALHEEVAALRASRRQDTGSAGAAG